MPKNDRWQRIFRGLLYLMPVALVFSYFPVIRLGGNETMNFELSVAILWLVIFDVYGFIYALMRLKRKKLDKLMGGWTWWLAPFFVSLSVFWSLNPLRGGLTIGVMWAIIIAIYIIYLLKDSLDVKFWRVFLRWFFGAAVGVSVWCLVQSLMDVLGVPQEVTQLCDGCKYQMFGFPRPNGTLIEPQFMGNLLLLPSLLAIYLGFKNRRYLLMGGFLMVVLFLTMSRGAIYALIIGASGMVLWMVFKEKKWGWKFVLGEFGVVIAAFLVALNLQGALSVMSPTSDGYLDGIGKVINHLSLGVIEVKNENEEGEEVVEKPVEKSEEKVVENSGENDEKDEDSASEIAEKTGAETDTRAEAAFDGYVAESTDTRVRLAGAAMEVWRKDFATMLFGVGIGGAGQALYDNGFSPAPKEIVQNEYASLLLETGLVGVGLIIFSVIMIMRLVFKNKWAGVILASFLAYGVSIMFFSGIPNVIHIPLFLGMTYFMGRKKGPTIVEPIDFVPYFKCSISHSRHIC